MKRICLLWSGAVFCFQLALLGADPPAEAGDGVQTPLDLRKNQALLEWNRKTLAGDYDRIGSHDPKWDRAAHAALEEFARLRANPETPSADVFKRIANSARDAIAAKCDDPLV